MIKRDIPKERISGNAIIVSHFIKAYPLGFTGGGGNCNLDGLVQVFRYIFIVWGQNGAINL
jgi:hypothetical protein